MTTATETNLPEVAIPCHVDSGFASKLHEVALVNDLTAEQVYAMWKQYSSDCRSYDQSAIWEEFLGWYRKQLPNLPANMYRLG